MKPLITIAAFIFFTYIMSADCLAQSHGDAYVTGSIADAVNLIPILHTDSASSSITGVVKI
jgi:hypothetical protein